MNRVTKVLVSIFFIFIFIAATMSTWVYSKIEDALPILNGKKNLFGLSSSAIIERDEQGIATIKASNRTDIALATGFIHAQERFFQMDLLRRNSAGELSSLFGKQALDYDKSIRRHRFRERARIIVQALPAEQQALLKAYTLGVNQGLDNLMAAPFEYLFLRQAPVVWQEEDSVLAVLSMYIDLQYHDGKRERTLGAINDLLGEDVYAFLNPKGSQWDAAIDRSQFKPSEMPSRAWPSVVSALNNIASDAHYTKLKHTNSEEKYATEQFPGSNNWAVAGDISQTGSAIVANDMHLKLRVPNTWFRASFEYPNNSGQQAKITGLTLPGTPNMIIGSNGNIAWGYTNSYGDWSDVIKLETDESQKNYMTPQGYKPFIYHKQIIAVKGQESVEIELKETQWGPVIGSDSQGNLLAYRWVAHDVNAVNMTQIELEMAKTVDEAFSVASRTGIPAQNLMVGDSEGNIGWTIMGPIPRKKGNIGDIPTSWANGENGWLDYLSPEEYPNIKNPEDHRLWTANARVVGGKMLDKLGNGGYALGARASQIRDDLFEKPSFSEQDLLTIALDDEALFLKRWQAFILDNVVTESSIKQHANWQDIHDLLINEQLKADVDSIAYRIVRNFRLNLRNDVFAQLNSRLSELDEGFAFSSIRHQSEIPLWQLINTKPDNFLWRNEDSWQQLFEQAMLTTIDDMTQSQPLSEATWGQQNTAQIQHPLSKAVPLLGRWLDMPATPLAGDSYMPRVQGAAFGASERMVVSPGHEEGGILQMPTSQAGHPWSPYYGVGHSDWEQGKASPFLPGKTKYTLTLLSY
ncbi:penicillin acylase family protein [Colwelliaceae bacterium 6471]